MFDNVILPFTATELLENTMSFIKLLGPFVLLGIAVMFTPRIITVIKGAIGRGGRNSA